MALILSRYGALRRFRRGTETLAGLVLLAFLLPACSSGGAPGEPSPEGEQRLPPGAVRVILPALPDSLGIGPHVLALKTSANGELWAGTYGDGIYVLRRGAREWEHIAPGDSGGISWGFVNSIAFGEKPEEVWYGTVGNGYGVSRDGGKTWRNWQFSELGPEFQYVAPDGIRWHDDRVYVATADGLRISSDGGTRWLCVGAVGGVKGGSPEREGACAERLAGLPSEYLLSLDVTEEGTIWVGHLRGLSYSEDDGRTWRQATGPALPAPVRDVLATPQGVWALTETNLLRDSTRNGEFGTANPSVPGRRGLPLGPRALVRAPELDLMPMRDRRGQVPPQVRRITPLATQTVTPTILTSFGAVVSEAGTAPVVQFLAAAERFRPAGDLWAGAVLASRTIVGSKAGLQRVVAGEAPMPPRLTLPVAQPEAAKHLWLRRPVPDSGANSYIDGTYRYGSTMGGNLQQHQGVEFNNPAGTPVYAAADGVVVYAGGAEAGANTVAIRHDRQWEGQYVFTTYYHNSSLEVRTGQTVRAGELIARVGNTGRATNDHLHLEVHVAPGTDSAAIVNPAERFPPHTRNPQLWLEPVPGTGVVAGRVLDSAGQPVAGAKVYGLVVPYPEETPFSFAETYLDRAHSDPAYGEHFAVGDVAPGGYLLAAVIDGQLVWRRARVTPGMVTFVEFRAGVQ